MSKVKWRAREFTPKNNQAGVHSWFSEVVVNNDIDNAELARKIAARTGFKAYECQAVVAAIADIVGEEVLESNRISLANEAGTKMLSIYPKVQGSVSDTDVETATTEAHSKDASVAIRTTATEADLTPDKLKWTLGCTVGIKFSKNFALNKQAQKVKFVATDTVIPNDDEQGSGDNNSGDNGGEGGGANNE